MQRAETSYWCPWPESNQHSLRNSILSRARLPVPPQGPPDIGLKAAVAKPAEYSGRPRWVNPRGCDFGRARQVSCRGLPPRDRRRPDVTLDAAANPSHAGRAANPALTAALAVAILAAATLAGAWFFQLVLDIRPCPLCLEQRYAYYLAVPLGLLVALVASKGAPRPVLLAGPGPPPLSAPAQALLGPPPPGRPWGACGG